MRWCNDDFACSEGVQTAMSTNKTEKATSRKRPHLTERHDETENHK